MPLTTRKKKETRKGGSVELVRPSSVHEEMELRAGRRFADNVGEAQVEVYDYSGAKWEEGWVLKVASVVLQVSGLRGCGEGLLLLLLL